MSYKESSFFKEILINEVFYVATKKKLIRQEIDVKSYVLGLIKRLLKLI